MAGSEVIKEIVNHIAIQAATAVMMVFKDADTEPKPSPMVTYRVPQRQRYSGAIHEKSLFNLDAQDWYVKLMSFEKEVRIILGTRVYSISDEEKSQ